MDLAIKWRFFRALPGGSDPETTRLYCWHIEKRVSHRWEAGLPMDGWKRSVEDYIDSAHYLHASMARHGFLPDQPVPVDRQGEMLGGAHRVACALALGIENIPVKPMTQEVWAPPWGRDWFIEQGMTEEDLARLDADWEAMHDGDDIRPASG